MNNSTKTTLTFCDLLTVAFIVLKLTGVITWSWWWVLSPIWIPLAIVLIVFIIVVIIASRT
jgi:hypothetical protein